MSQIVSKCYPSSSRVQQQPQCSVLHQLTRGPLSDTDWAHSRRFQHSLSTEEQDLLRHAARFSSSSSALNPAASSSHTSSGSGSTGSAAAGGGPGISPSCDVPPEHVLHELYRNRERPLETTGSNVSLYKVPTRISDGTISFEDFQQEDHVLSRFYEEGVHGGLGRRFRRKVPLFQVRRNCCAHACVGVWWTVVSCYTVVTCPNSTQGRTSIT